ncbi:MAG TPA: pilus (MSHA type) biogenesis protein MshL [Gammaproteobacteria bacterium]|nr:pilus (MSHA type) biogenesis protein MshL [Gammaproteobacteria bacterium]
MRVCSVYKPTLQTRIYHLNYINVTRNGYSQTNISAGGQASGSSSESNSSSGSSSQSSSSSSGSVIETNSKADLWKEIEESVLSIINRGAGRQVVVSPQSGAIVVRAMPDELRDVEAFLHSTQDTMHRQVILEAKIIEVELSDGFQAGINWAALGKDDGNTLLAGQTGGGTVFNNGLSDIAGNVGNLDPDAYSAVANAATSAFGGIFSAALQIDDFTAFIELLKSQGDVQVLSSPRVSTINNQKAVIKVGSDEYFVTEVSSGDISGTGNTDNQVPPDITLTPFFSGIALDVTPQIDVNHGVTLHIHPSVSNVVDQTKNITVNGQQQSLPLALSSVRESDSIVHAKSGQLIVIGGLMQNTTENQRGATPLLGDLPLVGALFRHTKKRYKKSELVILLRPIVVESVDNWNQSIRESSNTINAISTYKNHR